MPKKRRSPAKGTKSRTLLLMMLRPQGATQNEITQATGWTQNTVSHFLSRMSDDYGLDIRSFPLPDGQRTRENGFVTYRLIGKIIARGKYRSFV